jgi:hypothetical protein
MLDKQVADLAPRARQDGEQTLRQAGRLDDPRQFEATSGDQLAGFRSTALPAASAGATFWASEAMGEFQA